MAYVTSQVKMGRFNIIEDINEFCMERGIFEESLRNAAATEGQLACAHFIEGDCQWFLQNLQGFFR